MIDIIVTISNYDRFSPYRVNIYKRESFIPIQTREIGINEGPDVTVKGLPEGFNYDAEVIRFCENGTRSAIRKPVNQSSIPSGCFCPEGYTATPDSTRCIRISIEAPTIDGTALTVTAGPTEGAYSREGIIVYNPGFNVDGSGSVAYASGNAHPYWASNDETTKGRLNLAGVWNAASPSAPLDTWIGFVKKILISTPGLYYVAMAGDDYVRFKKNGVVLVDQKQYTGPNPSNYNFNYWHCYPVWFEAGEHLIEMEGWNTSSQGAFAAEIYKCDLVAIQNVTTGTEATLVRQFTTLGQTEFTNNYSCREGYALDNSNPSEVVCKKIEYASCGG